MPRIFVCYRREDSAGYAGRIYDRLAARYGRRNVFMDIDTIGPGEDFAEVIHRTIERCDAVIAVIGRNWLVTPDDRGHPRILDPSDFVRRELETALTGRVKVIPALVGGARIPVADELPEGLRPLLRHHAIDIREPEFNNSVRRLITAVSAISRTKANLPSGRFRSSPASLSQDQAKLIIARHGFYSSDWNPAGKGIEHAYNPQIIEEALVVVDRDTELMWEKGVAAFAKYFRNPTPEARLAELNTKQFASFDNWRLPTLEEAMSLVTTHEEALATKKEEKKLYTFIRYSKGLGHIVFGLRIRVFGRYL